MTQKIIITVGKLFNLWAHSSRVFAKGALQVALFTVWCLKWSVKKRWIPKILQEIWEPFLHENNRHYNSNKFIYKFAFIPFFVLS